MSESLKKVLYFLGILDDGDVDWVTTHGVRQNVPVNTEIIREGHRTDWLYFILAGEFSVTSKRTSTEIARLTAGEILGEISFVDSRPPSGTVTATKPSVVGAVPIELLARKLERDLGFAARFYKAMAVALADRLRLTSILGLRPRVANEDETEEMPSHLLDIMSIAGSRFAEMQKGTWGGSTPLASGVPDQTPGPLIGSRE
jgi:CRP/FNR family transcriptional regulator, cyclic AMP receptor protein